MIENMEEYYVVLRTYSHTDRRHLWKVETRRMTSFVQAEDWKDFLESEDKNKKHKYFIVKVPASFWDRS